ncbi:MAG: rRNA maturation RNase YbeY [Candidatus Uhrbacteria bacterium]|nr:rRNA maturation RNase YbeY [Patescibacteria group bacterium]MBU1907382.1 rRNA maturation RNase YbeY [Patescibacteria group bacterium]
MLNAEINQSELAGGQRVPEKEIARLLGIIAKVLREKKDWVISIAFVDKDAIWKLNRDYRGKNQPTDVLSFTHKEAGVLGEVIICYEVAKDQAEFAGVPVREELIRLITHGVLHLFGHDHEKAAEEKIMMAIQEWIIDEYQK